MSVSNWFTTTFNVYRDTYVGNKSSKALQGTIKGHLQQASQEQVIEYADSIRLTHSVWCDVSADVTIGDRITSGARKWNVRAVQVNDVGDNQHLELLVEEAK